jgi:hypothetical protein
MRGTFLGNQKHDNYNEPLRASAEWWKHVRSNQILFVAGGDEIMLDPQNGFMDTFAVRFSLSGAAWPINKKPQKTDVHKVCQPNQNANRDCS